MKKLVFLLIFIGRFAVGQPIHVSSYNVRYANAADEQHGNGWNRRCAPICDLIAYEAFDLVGMQEVLKNQLDDLMARLSSDYACIGGGRDDGKTAGEYAPILYRKERFDLLGSGLFWLSQTPDRPSVGWDAKYPRICTWVRLRDRTSGKTLFFLNTHFDHVGENARLESARLLAGWIERHGKGGAVVLTGDFNVDQRSPSYRELLKAGVLSDSYQVASVRMAPNGTVNGFDPGKWSDRRIDHVLVTPGVEVLRYGLLTDVYWASDSSGSPVVRTLSDHYPVSVYLRIP